MHEFSIASSLVESVLDLANKQGSSRVLEVHLRVGKLRALSVEQVKFSYGILAKGTILEGSELLVEEAAGVVHCGLCGYEKEFNPNNDPSYHFGVPPLVCPRCGNPLTIEGGDDCVITKVRMIIPHEHEEETGSVSH
jgi:hydrogenase nickel incorporation protein HypA/HybF